LIYNIIFYQLACSLFSRWRRKLAAMYISS